MRMKNNPTNITSSGASKKLVPELRFPEFVDDREWAEDIFGQLFTYLPNNTLSRAELTEKNGTIQNVHYGDILTKYSDVLDVGEEHLPSVSDIGKIKNVTDSCLHNGDIVIADTAEDETAGKCTEIVNVENSLVVSGLHTIPCRPNKFFEKGYLGHYMNSNAFHNRLRPLMQGAKVTSISKNGLKSILFIYPHSYEEQKKIAQCLSSIDKLIVVTKSKLEQLKEHKRGLLQTLFPPKGKTLPKIRFPKFADKEEWIIIPLGNCLQQPPEYGMNAPAVPFSPSLPTYLRITDISDEGRFIKKNKKSVDTIITDSNSLHIGDIVFARTGSSVGKVYKYREEDGPLVFAGFLIRMRLDETKYDSEFVYQYLHTETYKKWVSQTSARSGQPGINSSEYSSLQIPFPTTKIEQNKIASLLSSLDDIIEQYNEKVKTLEFYKRGLIQKLFPKI